MRYLVLDALTRLQAGEDLALDGADPQLPLLERGRLEVPRLPRQRHDDELEGILLFCETGRRRVRLGEGFGPPVELRGAARPPQSLQICTI